MTKISFFTCDYPTANSPYILNLESFFKLNNIKVLFINKSEQTFQTKNKNRFKQFFSKYVILVKLYRVLLYDINFFQRLKKYYNELDSCSENIIAFEKMSLLILFLKKTKPIAYVSLESNYIFDSESLSEFFLSIFEKFYLKIYNVKVLSTSERRLEVLFKYINKKNRASLAIPVCSNGAKITEKSTYLRNKYNIPNDKKIVLIAGTMGHSLADEVLHSVKDWPEPFVLFLHSHNGLYSDKILNNTSKRIYFSSNENLNLSSAEELIYASSDISLVLYPNHSINYRLTAFSSGKLASSSRAGLPIIVSDFSEFNYLFSLFKFGLTSNVDSISNCLNDISKSYETFRSMSFSAYTNIYKFQKYHSSLKSFFNL